MDFSSYISSIWTIILTLTTVGYGDFYPRTFIGRLIIFIVCIWGMCIVSIMVVSLHSILIMGKQELKVKINHLTINLNLGVKYIWKIRIQN